MTKSFYTNLYTKGSKVYLRSIEDGQRKSEIIDFIPELYIKTNDAAKATSMSMRDEPLEKLQFTDSKEMKAFIESYKDIDGFSVYGSENIVNQFVSRNYPGNLTYDANQIRCAIVDIETFSGDIKVNEDGTFSVIDGPFPDPETSEFPINLITNYSTYDQTYYVWGLETFKGNKIGTYVHDENEPRVGKLKVVYKGFDDEYSLLNDFVNHWQQNAFDCWSGWYIEGFDNPYLTNRIISVCGDATKKKLSPWNNVIKKVSNNTWGKEVTVYDYVGCQMLDYKALFDKHAFMNPDNMKLATVAELVLGESKVDMTDSGGLNMAYLAASDMDWTDSPESDLQAAVMARTALVKELAKRGIKAQIYSRLE
jgi:hypothetical protein